jgi:hypothetical protein
MVEMIKRTLSLILIYLMFSGSVYLGRYPLTTTSLFEFSDNFATTMVDEYSGVWCPARGTYTITSEELVHSGSIGEPDFFIINEPKQFINGSIEVKAKTVSTYEHCGIAFRIQDMNNYYCWQWCNNYNTPDMELVVVVDGVETQLGSGTGSYNDLATFYTMKVVLSGSSIKTYVDGNLIDDVTDTTYSQGYVALYSSRASGQGTYDDFSMSMTYVNDTQTGLIEDNSDTYADFSYSGWDRGFGSGETYLCGRSGQITTIYYEHDSTLNRDVMNCGVFTKDKYIAFSVNEGDDVGSGVSSFTLQYPMIVLGGVTYGLDTQCDDTSWAMWGIVDAGVSTGHNTRSEIDYLGLNQDEASQGYDNTAGRKLKLWAS